MLVRWSLEKAALQKLLEQMNAEKKEGQLGKKLFS